MQSHMRTSSILKCCCPKISRRGLLPPTGDRKLRCQDGRADLAAVLAISQPRGAQVPKEVHNREFPVCGYPSRRNLTARSRDNLVVTPPIQRRDCAFCMDERLWIASFKFFSAAPSAALGVCSRRGLLPMIDKVPFCR